jgi:hypothetical protein
MIAKKGEFYKAERIFEQMCQMIKDAGDSGLRVDQVERSLFQLAMQLCLALLAVFVKSVGSGNEGKTIQRDGRVLRRLKKKRQRRYVSIFGELSYKRYAYARREGQKIEWVPTDARLGMPAGEFSYVLEDWQQKLILKDPYGEAVESVESWLGIKLGVRTCEQMNHRLATFVEPFRAEQEFPTAEEEGEILVVTADGKGVPMRRPLEERLQEWKASRPKSGRGRKPKKRPPIEAKQQRSKRLGKGEKRTKKQMAYVGAIYSIDRHVRTADDILEEVNRRSCNADRPQPRNKRLHAEMTRILEGELFQGIPRLFLQMAAESEQRDPACEKPLVCLMDGQRSLWDTQAQWFERAVCILDLFHVMERIWKAAYVFHAERSPEAQAFVDRYLRMLLEGKVGYVIGVWKRLLKTHHLKGNRRTTLLQVIQYYENNAHYMRYDKYLAAGYPIGSGVIEGTCRYLVKDRMERTGMRWEITGAQAMLDLRSVYFNGDWADFLEDRVQREQEALYGQAA